MSRKVAVICATLALLGLAVDLPEVHGGRHRHRGCSGCSGCCSAPSECCSAPLPCCDGCETIIPHTYTAGAKLNKIIYAKPAPLGTAPGNASELVVGDIVLEADGVPITSDEAWRNAIKTAHDRVMQLVVLDAATGKTFLSAVDLKGAAGFGASYNIVPVNVTSWGHYLSRPAG